MNLYLNNEDIKSYLKIIDEKISAHQKNCEKAISIGNENMASMNCGIIIGYAMARDILFNLQRVAGSKSISGEYNTIDLRKFTLEYFIKEFNNKI